MDAVGGVDVDAVAVAAVVVGDEHKIVVMSVAEFELDHQVGFVVDGVDDAVVDP